jgi:Amt family ammonium transporter
MHNMPFVMLGTAMLWFGWFGFNAGSALRPDLVAATAFINTNTATAAAVLTWVLIERIKNRKTTTFGAASGAVAGLVAITPCAGFIKPLEAIIVGIVAALGCHLAIKLKDRLGYDDALDVVSLHLVGGVIGSLCVGLFAAGNAVNPASDATGLFHGGGFRQLAVQSIAVVAVVAYSFAITYLIGWLIGLVFRNRGRVLPEQEREGLDQSLHGESAYVLTGTISAKTPTGV